MQSIVGILINLEENSTGAIITLIFKGKGKGHILAIAPLIERISLQEHSGMARVVEGFHSFTCTPTHLSTSEMNHSCLSLPSQCWTSFSDPGGMGG